VFHHGKNIVKVELFVPLLCVCAILPEKGHSWNDLYCVRQDVKPYSLTHCDHHHLAQYDFNRFMPAISTHLYSLT